MTKYLALDLETSLGINSIHGSSWREPCNDFYSIQWATSPYRAKVIHTAHGSNRTLRVGIGADLYRSDVIVGVNLQFDLGYIFHDQHFRDFIRKGGTVWDVSYVHYLLSAQRHFFPSLAELQKYYLGITTKEYRITRLFQKDISPQDIIKARNRCKRVFAMYEYYCKQDVTSPLLIMQKQYIKAKKLGMLNYILLMQDFLLSLIVLENTGIKLDVRKTEETLRDLKIKALEKLEKAQEIVRPLWNEKLPPFNVNSPLHKSAMLFGGWIKFTEKRSDGYYKNGKEKFRNVTEQLYISGFMLDPEKYSRAGAREGVYSTDVATIININRDCDNALAKEYCNLQIEAMNLNKMCSTYLQAFLDRNVSGYLYPQFNVTQTVTGRLSSKEPNLQNVPAHGAMGGLIESLMIAPDGWKCVSVDFSSLECYVRAWLSRDVGLINDTLQGIDFHAKWLSYSSGKSYEEVIKLVKSDPDWAEKRSKAKGITFQEAYGAGVKSLAKSTGYTEDETRQMLDGFYVEYPSILEFRKSVMDSAIENSQTITKSMMSKNTLKKHDWENGLAKLPIFTGNSYNPVYYEDGEYQTVGTYVVETGQRVSFYSYGQLDRKLRLQNKYMSTQVANYPIQGTAHTVLAAALIQLKDYIVQRDDIKMILTIHDSIRFYIKDDENLDNNIKNVVKCFVHANEVLDKRLGTKVPFNFGCSVEIGDDFGEMITY